MKDGYHLLIVDLSISDVTDVIVLFFPIYVGLVVKVNNRQLYFLKFSTYNGLCKFKQRWLTTLMSDY